MDTRICEDLFKAFGCLAAAVALGLILFAGCVGYHLAHFGR